MPGACGAHRGWRRRPLAASYPMRVPGTIRPWRKRKRSAVSVAP